jgi:hypothetical protein
MSRPSESALASALSPFERAAEIIFGILMAISVTAAFASFRRVVQAYAAERPRLWSWHEVLVAGIITLLVFGSTFPLVIPFMAMDDAWLALRASHAVAVAFLFFLGWRIGRWSGASPWASGAVFATVGVVLAVTCVVLGG